MRAPVFTLRLPRMSLLLDRVRSAMLDVDPSLVPTVSRSMVCELARIGGSVERARETR